MASLTPNTEGCPFVEVFIDTVDCPAGTATMRVYRLSDNRTWLVRGGVDIAPGVAALDYEIPFQVDVAYRAECFDNTGVSLGYAEAGSITLDYEGTIIHQPLTPSLYVGVTLRPDSYLAPMTRPTPGAAIFTEAGGPARWVGGIRQGQVGTAVSVFVANSYDADTLQSIMGAYETSQVAVVCIRTSTLTRWPRTFFAQGDLAETWLSRVSDRYQFDSTMTEVNPPFPGLSTPLLTYDDLDASYATYDAMDAAYATYTDKDRDYSLAGAATA